MVLLTLNNMLLPGSFYRDFPRIHAKRMRTLAVQRTVCKNGFSYKLLF